MLEGAEQGIGILLTCVVLLDIFLTVLYARIGTSLIGPRVGWLVWAALSRASLAANSRRGVVLSFCGPINLVLLVCVWALGLTLGAALVMHPGLGSSIRTANGETPTDFITAVYVGGASMAIVGASDFTPHTRAMRLLFLINSLIGMSVMSLTLTYLMQVYSALRQRNVMAMNIHLLSGRTGDAAELLARLGPQGRFGGGYTHLSDIAGGMIQAKEAHHFYPVLFYFRFDDAYHSVSRSALVALDTVSLIKTALDNTRAGWLKETGAVTQIWEASMMLVTALEETFLPHGASPQGPSPPQHTQDLWRDRYGAALARLQKAGIQTVSDRQAGADAYVACRMQWDRHVANLAPFMAYSPEEVDVAMSGLSWKATPGRPSGRPRLAD